MNKVCIIHGKFVRKTYHLITGRQVAHICKLWYSLSFAVPFFPPFLFRHYTTARLHIDNSRQQAIKLLLNWRIILIMIIITYFFCIPCTLKKKKRRKKHMPGIVERYICYIGGIPYRL